MDNKTRRNKSNQYKQPLTTHRLGALRRSLAMRQQAHEQLREVNRQCHIITNTKTNRCFGFIIEAHQTVLTLEQPTTTAPNGSLLKLKA